MMEVKTPEKTPSDNLKPPWKPGQTGNPNGRPNGTRNFITVFEEMLKEYAKANGTTPELEKQALAKKAMEMAKKGNFNFYKDLVDRYFGKAPDQLNIDGNISNLPLVGDAYTPKMLEIAKKYEEEMKQAIDAAWEKNDEE